MKTTTATGRRGRGGGGEETDDDDVVFVDEVPGSRRRTGATDRSPVGRARGTLVKPESDALRRVRAVEVGGVRRPPRPTVGVDD